MSEASAVDTKKCRSCQVDIPSAARICSGCKSHQSRWRDGLLFFSSIAGLVVVAVSGVTFTIGATQKLYREANWKDEVALILFETGPIDKYSSVIANTGDGPVFVTDITVRWEGGNATFPINASIAPDSFYARSDNTNFNSPSWGRFLGTRTGVVSAGHVRTANLVFDNSSNEECLAVVFFDPQNSNLLRMTEHYLEAKGKLLASPAKATITFVSAKSGARANHDVTISTTFIVDRRPKCRELIRSL